MTETTPEYTILDHTADLGVMIKGTGLIDLFENAGRTLLHLMFRIRLTKQADFTRLRRKPRSSGRGGMWVSSEALAEEDWSFGGLRRTAGAMGSCPWGSTKISISGNDIADLMVRWLTEILYLFAGENLVVTGINIDSLSPSALEATLRTAPFDPKSHKIIREIKAVTYHQIAVTDENGIWTARVIFDL